MQLAKEGERSIHAVQNAIFFKILSIKIRINPSQEEGGGVRGGGEREREGARRKRTFSTRFLAPPPPPPSPVFFHASFSCRLLCKHKTHRTRRCRHSSHTQRRNIWVSQERGREKSWTTERRCCSFVVFFFRPHFRSTFIQSARRGDEASKEREREPRYQKCGNLRGGEDHTEKRNRNTQKKNIFFFFFCHLFSRSLSLFSASLPSLHCAAATSAAAAAVGAAAAAAAADALLPPPPLTSSSPPETTLM